jgi:hypothetical protein
MKERSDAYKVGVSEANHPEICGFVGHIYVYEGG